MGVLSLLASASLLGMARGSISTIVGGMCYVPSFATMVEDGVCSIGDESCQSDLNLIQTKAQTRAGGLAYEEEDSAARMLDKDDLFEGCLVKSHHVEEAPPIALVQETVVESIDEVACDGTWLYDFSGTNAEQTCCPKSAGQKCSGCAKFAGGECAKLKGGVYTRTIGGASVAQTCLDTPKWLDADNNPCTATYSNNNCNDILTDGFSSNQACCACGDETQGFGGTTIATEFEYIIPTVEVGGSVVGFPSPQTASTYTIDAGCELEKYQLALDGNTGRITGTVR